MVSYRDTDNRGQTILHMAVKNNDHECVELLLEYFESNPQCDVNHKDLTGYTPLHVAVDLYVYTH